jgi:RNA polymerase sigma-70 factor, ECF subfamily
VETTTPTSTLGLLERIGRGDPGALGILFDRYSRRLAVRIHYRLSPEMRARFEIEDVLQETCLRAVKDFNTFQYRSAGSFWRWICVLADHALADLARHEGRRKRRALQVLRFRSPSNPAGPEPEDPMTPSRILAADEKYQALIRGLDALPENYRSVILLAKLESLNTLEIAEKMGLSAQQTSLLLHRAIRRLQQELTPQPSHG